ncbi:MAG: DUF309 domain-containing protein [Candidatus Latescibacteria bacterium]|nr:DUF309 domain-containing protein [Candidatus Latescibacterota bacterium]
MHSRSSVRYTSYSLPTRRYLPGEGTHPRKHSDRPHIPELPVPVSHISSSHWRHSKHYLYAIDLINLAYWWEAHEVLETLWIGAGKETDTGVRIQGLIQTCAALIKAHQGEHEGAQRLLAKGLIKLETGPESPLGFDNSRFLHEATAFVNGETIEHPRIELMLSQ